MPSLKELRGRINSVKSTRKITSAMKMVAAAKLRRAQAEAESGRPYAELMERMVRDLARAAPDDGTAHPLLRGRPDPKTELVILVTSDRGLAGAFNANPTRQARLLVRRRRDEGRTVRLLAIGRKGGDLLRREAGPDAFLDAVPSTVARGGGITVARGLAARIVSAFDAGEIDRVTLVYNRFVNVMSQTPVVRSLLPIEPREGGETENEDDRNRAATARSDDADRTPYEFEPEAATVLARLLPEFLAAAMHRAMLESAAGEQGARMTAMDNATRNAGKAIDRLTLRYNQTRQANITRELIEIISGADAV